MIPRSDPRPEAPTDAQTAARSCDPDRALVERHWGTVYRYLRILGAEAALAEDLAQDALVVALQKGIEDRGPETAAWLRRTARFLFLKSRRRPPARALEAAEEVYAAWSEQGEDAWLDALAQCREGLAERARRALVLRYRDGLSRDAIAAALGMTADGVKTLLRRTRSALRTCIEQRLGSR